MNLLPTKPLSWLRRERLPVSETGMPDGTNIESAAFRDIQSAYKKQTLRLTALDLDWYKSLDELRLRFLH